MPDIYDNVGYQSDQRGEKRCYISWVGDTIQQSVYVVLCCKITLRYTDIQTQASNATLTEKTLAD